VNIITILSHCSFENENFASVIFIARHHAMHAESDILPTPSVRLCVSVRLSNIPILFLNESTVC